MTRRLVVARPDRLRILTVDEHAVFGVALSEDETDFEVVDEASNGPLGVLLAGRRTPGVIVMDVEMDGDFDVTKATRRILASSATSGRRLTVIGRSAADCKRLAMLDAGAFVSKSDVARLPDET